MNTSQAPARFRRSAGYTLVEMIVVTLLLMIAMLGLLAVFDASARINKSETDVADAQGNVRYGVYQMTRVIRMAGAGGLYVTQAVLNSNEIGWPGINVGGSYDNIAAGTIDDTSGTPITIRPGTDMIQIRGVILSPLLGFDAQTGCSGCQGSNNLDVKAIVGDPQIGEHVNNDAVQRPQFSAIDAYTASAAANSMLVVVQEGNSDLHAGCAPPPPSLTQRFPQPIYNVGRLTAQTQLVSSNTFGAVDFGDGGAQQYNGEVPSISTNLTPTLINKVRRAGVLDDIIFFIAEKPLAEDPDREHPYLAQGIRRGDVFEVTPLAEDVEDLQIAYGIDLDGDFAVTRDAAACAADPVTDPDPNFSLVADCDEWQPNVTGEATFTDVQFQSLAAFPAVNEHPGIPPAIHCPRLRGVMISLLAKARDSDPTYRGPAAKGQRLMNVELNGAVPKTAVPGNFRRRVQTLKINLRNYEFQG